MDTRTEQTEQSASTSSSQNSSLQAHTQRSVTVKKKARLELEHASTKLGDSERADLPTNKNNFFCRWIHTFLWQLCGSSGLQSLVFLGATQKTKKNI